MEDENKEGDITNDINIEEETEGLEDKVKKLKEELKKCQKDKEEYLAGWQRAKADFINARKDEDKRRLEFVKFANETLISEILIVLDSFDLALDSLEEEQKNGEETLPTGRQAQKLQKTLKGFYLLKAQLEDILKKYGLKVIKAAGEKFDPEFHEAVAEAESDKESGTIIDEFQKGYMLNGKVLRPAKVKTAK